MVNLDDFLQDKRLVVERIPTRLDVYIFRMSDERQLYHGAYSGTTDDISTADGIERACGELVDLLLVAGERVEYGPTT